LQHAVHLLEALFAANGGQVACFQVLAVFLDRRQHVLDAVRARRRCTPRPE
jgi:hypothetical protein